VKGRCLICRQRIDTGRSGLLSVHADATGMLCKGSAQMPEIPTGQGKRIIHRDTKP